MKRSLFRRETSFIENGANLEDVFTLNIWDKPLHNTLIDQKMAVEDSFSPFDARPRDTEDSLDLQPSGCKW